jgi:hypothetical protein
MLVEILFKNMVRYYCCMVVETKLLATSYYTHRGEFFGNDTCKVITLQSH